MKIFFLFPQQWIDNRRRKKEEGMVNRAIYGSRKTRRFYLEKKRKKENRNKSSSLSLTEMNELQVRVLDENDANGYNNNNHFDYKRV